MAIYIANFKLNKTADEAIEWLQTFIKSVPENVLSSNTILVAASPIVLPYLSEYISSNKLTGKVLLAAQDVSEFIDGEHTGAVSAKQLSSVVDAVIIGHAEVRSYLENFSEDIFNQKIKNCLDNNLRVILCVGEKLINRQNNEAILIIENQLSADLANIHSTKLSNIIFAYEPVWAIGTGFAANSDEVTQGIEAIRNYISRQFNIDNAEVIYGGSSNLGNIETLKKLKIDGYIVGKASLDPINFANFIISSLNI